MLRLVLRTQPQSGGSVKMRPCHAPNTKKGFKKAGDDQSKQIRGISKEELAELSRRRDNLVTQIHEAVHGTSAQNTSAH